MPISVTQKEIADMALARLGQESLSSYDANTRNGRAIRKHYNLAVLGALEDGVWSFATKRQVLSPLSSSPAFGWLYAFELPSDFLKEQIVRDDGDAELDYVIEGESLLCDDNVVRLIYTYNNTSISTWSAKFVECLVLKLAALAAYEITGSRSEANSLNDAYKIALFEALSNDSKGDGEPYVTQDNSWVVE